MTDISITAANVVKGADATIENGIAGASITAGQAVYVDETTGKYLLSDNNAAGKKTVRGIALHAASANQPLQIQTRGEITIGGTLTAGSAYYLSSTAGGIAPVADITSGMDVVLLGLAKSASVLVLDVRVPGVTL